MLWYTIYKKQLQWHDPFKQLVDAPKANIF